MPSKKYFELFNQYINGWKQNNINLIENVLDPNCTVIESHGPTYHGINEVKKWFELWLAAKGHVTKWQILTFCFCENEQAAFSEWDFTCIVRDIKYTLLGISRVNFKYDKISYIHEYKMTQESYGKF